MSTTPMEPMDTYLCILLKLNLISATGSYTQTQICSIISSNQTAFNAYYNDLNQRAMARDEYLDTVHLIDIIDKQGDC